MKNYFLLLTSFLLISCSSSSQNRTAVDGEFTTVELKLSEYKIDSCLVDLLREVVNLDKTKRFPSEFFYYELLYEDMGSYKKLSILPSRWKKSMTLDFRGIIKEGNMSFLCRGDFENDSLFQIKRKSFSVILKKPKEYQYDSVDVVIESYSWKPTLAGKFTFCKGDTIDIYILVGQKMEKYLTKENE